MRASGLRASDYMREGRVGRGLALELRHLADGSIQPVGGFGVAARSSEREAIA